MNQKPAQPHSSAHVLPQPKCRRWPLIALCLGLFAAGLATGSAATLYKMKNRFHFRAKDPSAIPDRITRRMRYKLDLTESQAQQVHEILTRRMQDLFNIRRQVQPQIEAHFDATEKEISQILTPDQTRKWRKWFRRFRHRWGPPHPPGSPGPHGLLNRHPHHHGLELNS